MFVVRVGLDVITGTIFRVKMYRTLFYLYYSLQYNSIGAFYLEPKVTQLAQAGLIHSSICLSVCLSYGPAD